MHNTHQAPSSSLISGIINLQHLLTWNTFPIQNDQGHIVYAAFELQWPSNCTFSVIKPKLVSFWTVCLYL